MKKIYYLSITILFLLLVGCAASDNMYNEEVFIYHDNITVNDTSIKIYKLDDLEEISLKKEYSHVVGVDKVTINYEAEFNIICNKDLNNDITTKIVNNVLPITNNVIDYYSIDNLIDSKNMSISDTVSTNLDDEIILFYWYLPFQIEIKTKDDFYITTMYIPFSYSFNVVRDNEITFNNNTYNYNDFLYERRFI